MVSLVQLDFAVGQSCQAGGITGVDKANLRAGPVLAGPGDMAGTSVARHGE